MALQGGIQEEPKNPFERGYLQVSGGYPRGGWATITQFGGQIRPSGLETRQSPQKIFEASTRASIGHVPSNICQTTTTVASIPSTLLRQLFNDRVLAVARGKAWAASTPSIVSSNPELKKTIERELAFILYSAKEQVFEDGIESEFSHNFVRLITNFKNLALDTLGKFVDTGSINPEVLSEAVRWLPRIDDTYTYNQRLSLITRCLTLPWARVRDAAVLALSSLADKAAIQPLRRAIENEDVDELRADMLEALTYLETDSRDASS